MNMMNLQSDADSSIVPWRGGFGELFAGGVFGGGTLQLFRQEPGDNEWIPVGVEGDLATISSTGTIIFAAAPCNLKLTLSGATAPNINFGIGRVQSGGNLAV